MVKAVFQYKPDSIYDDTPWEAYDFPSQYLRAVEATVGDWIVYYETKKALGGRGRMAYFAVAKVRQVVDHRAIERRHYALIDPASFLPFDRPVPPVLEGTVMEAAREAAPGVLMRGGSVQRAVRPLPEHEFERIVRLGLGASLAEESAPEGRDGMAEGPAVFERPVAHVLLNRPVRDRAFRRQVLEAYEGTCAISGLSLRNGGGWMEVEAAHIKAVEHGGPDIVQNGLALSATLHKMFDRGLISVAADHSILVSENKVPREVQDRLFSADRRLRLPRDERLHPDPTFLAFHREVVYGGGDGGFDWRA